MAMWPVRCGSKGCRSARKGGKHDMTIKIKRAYEQADQEDGVRILVDRLWPRGLTKEKASINLWLKDIAPSTELRQWFGHDPTKWEEFKQRYLDELKENDEQIWHLR